MKPDEFIAAIAPAARASMVASKIPASFTIAQAADESSWGTSKTTVHACNLFNIKADRSWHGPVWAMPSTEHVGNKDVLQAANWRCYPNWQACFDDRAKFFKDNPRYAHCFAETTGEGWARGMQAAGYATDQHYADKIISIMHTHGLSKFDVMEQKK